MSTSQNEEYEYGKANACRFLRAWQPDERDPEERLDGRLGCDRQRHFSPSRRALRFGSLVFAGDDGDRDDCAPHDSRLRRFPA
ncbi:MAG TPA: hypothetical protein VJT69_08830 [Pyrinomonadaceae bacterium]|nr:hypothetical protein [Pyrinomonadaceae bacterium]